VRDPRISAAHVSPVGSLSWREFGCPPRKRNLGIARALVLARFRLFVDRFQEAGAKILELRDQAGVIDAIAGKAQDQLVDGFEPQRSPTSVN
jgi:hypothetical protein